MIAPELPQNDTLIPINPTPNYIWHPELELFSTSAQFEIGSERTIELLLDIMNIGNIDINTNTSMKN